ncbi:unnamed protein product [Effrenium voratum]|nr:unnamed protein product [Effrenium voratum]
MSAATLALAAGPKAQAKAPEANDSDNGETLEAPKSSELEQTHQEKPAPTEDQVEAKGSENGEELQATQAPQTSELEQPHQEKRKQTEDQEEAPGADSGEKLQAGLLKQYGSVLVRDLEQPDQPEHKSKRQKVPSKRVLVVRHGEGVHQLKGKAWQAPRNPKLGPELTKEGLRQARAAGELLAKELAKLAEEGLSRVLVVTSNLFRALQTALQVAPAKVVVHPALRERILDERDEPSELNTLREWLVDEEQDHKVQLELYEDELVEAGAMATAVDFTTQDLHSVYLQSCRDSDLKDSSAGHKAKQNKEMLLKRAAGFTQWLEEFPADVAIVVGHAVLLGMITGDKEWLENGEVRSYHLQEGYWKRLDKVRLAKPKAPPALIPAAGPAWQFTRMEPKVGLRPRGSLAKSMT